MGEVGAWQIGAFRHDRGFLEACLTVLVYETNRPFELWYGTRDTPPVDELHRIFRRAHRLFASGSPVLRAAGEFELKGERSERSRLYAELKRQVRAYLRAENESRGEPEASARS